ncbi:hypothetical protein CRYPA_920 [uncultured Candidatus Thioglobus sp.]|nr:hypothetical protein CRYPA_920 [uncultured Candidatus Thioglobus sp.]
MPLAGKTLISTSSPEGSSIPLISLADVIPVRIKEMINKIFLMNTFV